MDACKYNIRSWLRRCRNAGGETLLHHRRSSRRHTAVITSDMAGLRLLAVGEVLLHLHRGRMWRNSAAICSPTRTRYHMRLATKDETCTTRKCDSRVGIATYWRSKVRFKEVINGSKSLNLRELWL